MSDFAFDVFLSYASADRELARQMVQWMRQSGLRVWIDEEQLVPGSRFRVGLQQGLQESRHLVALLTTSYSERKWTQRELDLFDLDADRSLRRILGIEMTPVDEGPLDQVFKVHQRIKWSTSGFDAEAFWNVHCGVTNSRPGPREEWARNGKQLLEQRNAAANPSNRDRFIEQIRGNSTTTGLDRLVNRVIHDYDWRDAFAELRRVVKQTSFALTAERLIAYPWAVGFAEFAATIALAALPKRHPSYSSWPFLDLDSEEIVAWFLMRDVLDAGSKSEIWFSWAVAQETWDALPAAAARAPSAIAEHFQSLARAAERREVSFAEFERLYDYGMMITPWNHFHLAWLATRLGDVSAGNAHVLKLCQTTNIGDVRTGRFLNRISTWGIFSSYRDDPQVQSELCDARDTLGMINIDMIPVVRDRLSELWKVARE